jgi:hypothetical protein
MADSPQGPWQSRGYIMQPTHRDRGNHPGIMDFKGKSYVFGQSYDLLHFETRQHFERRSVNVAEMHYNADGTIQEVPYWLDHRVLPAVGALNPYRRVEAETMAWGYGLRTEKIGIAGTRELVARARRQRDNGSIINQFAESTGRKNLYVYDLDEGEYIRLRNVDFGKKAARTFSITAAAADGASATISLHLDAPGGPLLASLDVAATGSTDAYRTFTASLAKKLAAGSHDLYICIDRAQGDVRLDWWQFGK